ncbi:MAG: HAMP domain-containing histidine kinase [Candidatus Omnitrophica bacterium]|nr:HAMP domain-containing histidine kinase [Candidatus Omnitrophota bacterium]
MSKRKLTPHLGWLFVVVVLVPGIVLSAIAMRSIGVEEIYIEKSIEKILFAEVSYVASRINSRLAEIEDDLSSSIDPPPLDRLKESFAQWEKTTPLVGVPFLVSPSSEILWPNYSQNLNDEEKTFLDWNRKFLSNEARIPVFENVAVAYKDDILQSTREQYLNLEPGKSLERVKGVADDYRGSSLSQESFASGSYSSADSSGSQNQVLAAQSAIQEFQSSLPIRKKVYEKAKEQGQNVLYRSVKVGQSLPSKQSESKDQESIFISELLNFSEITSRKDKGIIPRSIDGKLSFLFWKRISGGYVLGCVLSQEHFKDLILEMLPSVYSPSRILTLLDENGKPLIMPSEHSVVDWRKPIVASEISEVLPRWEVATYLSDPNMISSRARARELIMWILIVMLYASILSGGVVILRHMRSEIDLAQKKTSFVANVSHELKTPLTSIRMFTEMLKEKKDLAAEKKDQYLALMMSETERLTRLINNVLDFSRSSGAKKQYDFKVCDLVGFCRKCLEDERLRFESKGFKVVFNKSTDSLDLLFDQESLKQVLLNILENAEKYSPRIKEIELEVLKDNSSAVIQIKDRGVGINARDAKHIFKEFYRVDDSLTSSVRGTGLGLTIAKKIISDHGGDIQYQPREGGGSIFKIIIPIRRD